MTDPKNIVLYSVQSLADHNNLDYSGEEISCPFFDEFTKCVYAVKYNKKILSTEHSPVENKYRAKYIINAKSGVDFLCRTTLLADLPAISLTQEAIDSGIEVAWRKNIFHNIIDNAVLRFGDKIITSFNQQWMNIYLHVKGDTRPGSIPFYQNMIGNRPELISWSTNLPAAKIACPQPWPYSVSHKHAFVISNSYNFQVEHEYVFKLRLEDLLVMREKVSDDQYKERKFSRNLLLDNLLEKIEFPRMMSDTAVLDRRIVEIPEYQSIANLTNKRYFDHIMYYNFALTNNSTVLDIPIGSQMKKGSVIKSIYWILQDATTKQYNVDDIVISSIEFNQENYSVSEEYDPFYFQMVDPWYNNENFQERPNQLGQINFTMYGGNYDDLDVGIVGRHQVRFIFTSRDANSNKQYYLHLFVCTVGNYYVKDEQLIVEV